MVQNKSLLEHLPLLTKKVAFVSAKKRDLVLEKQFTFLQENGSKRARKDAADQHTADQSGKKEPVFFPSHVDNRPQYYPNLRPKHHDDTFSYPTSHLVPESEINKTMCWPATLTQRSTSGLINHGNTCFLNAIIQCLSHCAPFVQFLTTKCPHFNTCNTQRQFCALCDTMNIILSMRNTRSPIFPRKLVHGLRSLSSCFKPGRQEDAHEFLRQLVDKINDALLLGIDKSVPAVVKETSAVSQIFGGYLRSEISCTVCKYKSHNYENIMDLSLDVKGRRTIQDSLRHFMRTERLAGDAMYHCPACNRKVVAEKNYGIHTPPKILTLHLKRFMVSMTGMHADKLDHHVAFEDKFDLTPFLCHPPSYPLNYELFSVVVHAGHSTRSGHYYAVVKDDQGKWNLANDETVKSVKSSAVFKQPAYLLFYKQCSSSISSSLNHTKQTTGRPTTLPTPDPTPAYSPAPVSPTPALSSALSPASTPAPVSTAGSGHQKSGWLVKKLDAQEPVDPKKKIKLNAARPATTGRVFMERSWDDELGRADVSARLQSSSLAKDHKTGTVTLQISTQCKHGFSGKSSDTKQLKSMLSGDAFSMGASIKTWDGENLSANDTVRLASEYKAPKRRKDDQLLDKGSVKKVKKKKDWSLSSSLASTFQKIHDRKLNSNNNNKR